MNAKKILAIFMCMLLIALIPVAAGTNDQTKPKDPQAADIGYTHIMGLITKPKLVNNGHSLEFRCIWVHYMTHGIGEKMTGNLHMMQKLILPNDFTGYIRSHMIMARFSGELHF
jgi:hypothetical protein